MKYVAWMILTIGDYIMKNLIEIQKALEKANISKNITEVIHLPLSENDKKQAFEAGNFSKVPSFLRQYLGPFSRVKNAVPNVVPIYVKNPNAEESIKCVEGDCSIGHMIVFKDSETASLWKKNFSELGFSLEKSGEIVVAFGRNKEGFFKALEILVDKKCITQLYLNQIRKEYQKILGKGFGFQMNTHQPSLKFV